MTKNQNNKRLIKNVKFDNKLGLWGCNVWFGGAFNYANNERRYYYKTRQLARNADISDSSEFYDSYLGE